MEQKEIVEKHPAASECEHESGGCADLCQCPDRNPGATYCECNYGPCTGYKCLDCSKWM